MIKTNFLGDEIPKENVHCAGIACITVYSVMKMEKKVLSTSLFKRVQIKNEENKDVQIHKSWIHKAESESEIESDAELESKIKSDSDSDSE